MKWEKWEKENNKEMPILIVGNQEKYVYIWSIVLMFQTFKEIILESSFKNIDKMERIITLLKPFGIQAIDRKIRREGIYEYTRVKIKNINSS